MNGALPASWEMARKTARINTYAVSAPHRTVDVANSGVMYGVDYDAVRVSDDAAPFFMRYARALWNQWVWRLRNRANKPPL